jgi:IS605 OrfB family transposase
MPKSKRHVKVLRLQILKPAGDMTWDQLGKLLREARYRTFRLANLAVSELYLAFHSWRTGRAEDFKTVSMGQLNRRQRTMLQEEGASEHELDRFSPTGALPDTVCSALSQYKIRAITSPKKWREIVTGKSSLPTFRLGMAIPIRCDKAEHHRLERQENGDLVLSLMVCARPYPRLILRSGSLSGGIAETIDRLLANTEQSLTGYRQRCLEIKQSEQDGSWWLNVTYDFPTREAAPRSPETIVGVEFGSTSPAYVALNHGHARLGQRQFGPLAARIRSLQTQELARRRSMVAGCSSPLAKTSARAGHGQKRRRRSVNLLDGRIQQAYTTLNHQLSKSIVDFARDHNAGIIQLGDLSMVRGRQGSSFLGKQWRYRQLQSFVEYKAKEVGIEVRKVNPAHTTGRCSACGYLDMAGEKRPGGRSDGPDRPLHFHCPRCNFETDSDYNTARNLATADIELQISNQLAEPESTALAL